MSFSALITKSLIDENQGAINRIKYDLLNEDERNFVGWIKAYCVKYGVLPSIEAVDASEYDHFITDRMVTLPIEDLYDRFVISRSSAFVIKHLRAYEEKIELGDELDPSEFITLSRKLTGFKSSNKPSSIHTINRDDVYTLGGKRYYLGFPTIDKKIGFASGGDLIVIAGKPEHGKTWLMSHIAVNQYRNGKVAMITSAEMTRSQIIARIDSINVGIDSSVFRVGSDEDITKAREKVENYYKVNVSSGDLVIPDIKSLSPNAILAAIEEYNPDVVFVDAVYRAQSDTGLTGWAKQEEVVGRLKEIAIFYDIPIFVSTQLSKKAGLDGPDLDDLSKSVSFGEDSDTVIHVSRKNHTMQVTPIKSRHGTPGRITVDLAINFTHSTLKEVEI